MARPGTPPQGVPIRPTFQPPHWPGCAGGHHPDLECIVPPPEQAPPRWRVGRKLGRTLYKDGVFCGTMDTPELAAAIVEAMNAKEPA